MHISIAFSLAGKKQQKQIHDHQHKILEIDYIYFERIPPASDSNQAVG